MIEIWRDIKDYEGLYQVSNLGRVRNLKTNTTLKANKNNRGYLYVRLYKYGKAKHFFIHRLVATAFITNPHNLPQVNHKSEVKTDNRVENLEWITVKGNLSYGTRTEKVLKKTTNGKLSKIVLQYTKSGEFIKEWSSTHEIERQLGYDQGFISKCCRGKCKSAYDYIWKYKERVD